MLLKKSNESSLISFEQRSKESFVNILFEKINLGSNIQKLKGTIDMSREEAQAWCEQAKDEDTFVVHLIDAESLEEFEDWQKI